MLSRPHQAQASPADRAQIAALFGMAGLFTGVLLVATLAWLYSLTQNIQDQTAALTKLEKSVEDTDRVQRWALDTLVARGEISGSPRKFIDELQKTSKDLDAAREQAKSRERSEKLAVADNLRLTGEMEKLAKENEELNAKLKASKDDYEEVKKKSDDRKSELEAYYKTPPGELSAKYSTTLYAATAGWIVAALSSLGLLAFWMSRNPLLDELPGTEPRPGSITVPISGVGPTPPQPPAEEPPHQIL